MKPWLKRFVRGPKTNYQVDAAARAELLVEEALALENDNRIEDAEAKYSEAISLYPEGAGIHIHLGNLYASQNQLERAQQSFQDALAVKPEYAGGWYSLGRVHVLRNDLAEADHCLQAAVAADPEFVPAQVIRGLVLLQLGFAGEATESLRHASELDPRDSEAMSAYLFSLNYLPDLDRERSITEHLQYDVRFCAGLRQDTKSFFNSVSAQRRLKIGYVSGDLREHVVTRFLEPVLRCHDPDQVEVFAYHNYFTADAATARVRPLFHHWRDIARLGDDVASQLIQDDRIDVLIDLSGHTEHHRLGIFARQSAPVQATWLGYLNTTGVGAMNYRICDNFTDPPDLEESLPMEQAGRLPACLWCLPTRGDLPPVDDSPVLHNGYVTFGSFNNLAKVNHRVIELWSRILRSLPSAKLLMLGVPSGRAREQVLQSFAACGIASERLDLRPRCYGQAYFSTLGEVDIALDSFPYNGGTTSFDILSMGVPFVTLIGNRPAARGGLSILSNIGLASLAAADPADYVELAIALAEDKTRLQFLRVGMRARLAASPLTDIVKFTHDLENLYRQWWRQWCSTQ